MANTLIEANADRSMADEGDDPDLSAAYAADIPEIYFNSFANFLSNGDILSVLHRNGRPVAMVNMSLPIAKAYAGFLLSLVSEHEKAAGYTLDPNVGIEAASQEHQIE